MSKVFTYMMMALSIMLVMTFLGLHTGFTDILSIVGFSYDNSTGTISSVGVQTSTIYLTLLAILTVAVGSTLVIGFITKSSSENYVLLPFVIGTLFLFVQTFTGIMGSVISGDYPGWMAAVVVTIFLPITIGLLISLAEWFRGTDN